MKILIGILILLFVLTTIGFSDIAHARSCGLIFDQYSEEYPTNESDYTQGEAEFYPNSPFYTEDQRGSRYDRYHDEFENSRNENEFEAGSSSF